MLFNTFEFFIFFISFIFLYILLKNKNHKVYLICISSLLFYTYGEKLWVIYLIFSAIFSYKLAYFIYHSKSRRSKLYLSIGVTLPLVILIILKMNYFNLKQIPMGVSFFTFQILSYYFDIYKKRIEPANKLLNYFAYLTMFPQLIAGPICRAKDILPQLDQIDLKIPNKKIKEGFYLITLGIIKKAVIADAISVRVDQAFESLNLPFGGTSWLLIMIAYSWQIYFDFSGYSDVAIGLSRLMGINIKDNFNNPYFSKTIKEFWNNWHISLSTWFKDYIYIPLGGSKKGQVRLLFAILTTMVLSALWHGLAFNYIVWGLWHGFSLILFNYFIQINKNDNSFIKIGNYLYMLLVVFIGWIFFRSSDFSTSIKIINSILYDFKFIKWHTFYNVYKDLIILISLAFCIDFSHFLIKLNVVRLYPWMLYIIWLFASVLALIFQAPIKEFIYFRF